ncbi:hypothetical protein [Sabulicella glaciei]|uniref:Uncharacterized protein n=1 Tax=Sabulicella glaciei TaxID=2984948 RepID=A0ABT3NUI4_9PROT|nr:hypothetical protein [Roseococcus sp. MDT2-1-1]MCW8085813.1 hypothetical protein [Roseococcus sp. MDT2-1-1]
MGETFDQVLGRVPEPFQTALVEVCDTADLCRRWFADKGMQASAADIIAMTALVMAEAARLRTEKRDSAS